MGAGALVVEEGEVERGGCEGEAGEEVGDETHLLDEQCRFLDGASRSEPVSEIIRVWLLQDLGPRNKFRAWPGRQKPHMVDSNYQGR